MIGRNINRKKMSHKMSQEMSQGIVPENVTENVTEDVTGNRVEKMLKVINENNKRFFVDYCGQHLKY